jgi:hypothetical protein
MCWIEDALDRGCVGSRMRWIEDVLDRKRTNEEGESWLAGEARRRSAILEWAHHNRDDDSF